MKFIILDISTFTPSRKNKLLIYPNPNPNNKKLKISIIQFLKMKKKNHISQLQAMNIYIYI